MCIYEPLPILNLYLVDVYFDNFILWIIKAHLPKQPNHPCTTHRINNMGQVGINLMAAWSQDGVRAESFDIKKATVPTYS